MNFFGIGPMELVFILILALIIFGPGRLPEIGRAVGKSIRDFRAMTQEVTSQFSLDLEEAVRTKEARGTPTPAQGAAEPSEPSEPSPPPEATAEPSEAKDIPALEAEAQEPEEAGGAIGPSPEGEMAG